MRSVGFIKSQTQVKRLSTHTRKNLVRPGDGQKEAVKEGRKQTINNAHNKLDKINLYVRKRQVP